MNNTIQPTNPNLSPEVNRARLLDQFRIALHNHLHGKRGQHIVVSEVLRQLIGYTPRRCDEITRRIFDV